MKFFNLSAAAVVIAVTSLAASSAQASIIINANEVGGDVVFTLSGSVNKNSLTPTGMSQFQNNTDSIDPSNGQLFFGTPQINGGFFYSLPNLGGPPNFGPGPFTFGSVITGSIFNFYASSNEILLDAFYISGTSLANTMTFAGKTFASLGGRQESTYGHGQMGGSQIS